MLTQYNNFIGTPVYSMHLGNKLGNITDVIIDQDNLKIVGLYLGGRFVSRTENILDTRSIREYSRFGIVVDSADELVGVGDIVRLSKFIEANFNPISYGVESKKGSKLGLVCDFTFTSDDFTIQQLIVERPFFKRLTDPKLTIHRKEIIDITNNKIIVKDEEAVIKRKAETEDFVPNFVNPFRKTERDYAPAQTKTPDDKDMK